MNREPIYEAVFQYWAALLLGTALAFVTATRKAATWEAVAAEDQPALLQRLGGERGGP